MANHLKFIEAQITASYDDIERSMVAGKRPHADPKKTFVLVLQKERIFLVGRHLEVNRLFAKGPDSGAYGNVGWLLPHEIDACTVCSSPFSFLSYKYSCRACGNIICSSCFRQKGKLLPE